MMNNIKNKFQLFINSQIVLVLCLCTGLTNNVMARDFSFDTDKAWQTIKSDFDSFYTKDRLWRAAKVYSVGAVMAHSNFDTDFQNWHSDNVVSNDTQDFAKLSKLFGEKSLMVPLSLAAAALQIKDKDSLLGGWGERTMRAYLVAGPAMFAVQILTGGSRPSDEYRDAKWRPFNDNNGVSGHAFVGAVPFLTLAQSRGLEDWQRNLAYFASGLSAWSRVHDDAHFLSQAVLGWYMAWESTTNLKDKEVGSWYEVHPYTYFDGVGLGFTARW